MELLLKIIVCYLIGTIPTSYLLVKYHSGKDIHEIGSGNPGALNSFESTGNKTIGVAVLTLDFIKGAFASWLASMDWFGNNSYLPFMAGILWVIIGHNYNLFFGGRGGRGLATAAGAFGIINPFFVVSWLISWVLGYYIVQKNVHIANTIALIASPILMFSTPDGIHKIFGIINVNDIFALKITFAIACFIIILRHIKPLKDLVGIKEK